MGQLPHTVASSTQKKTSKGKNVENPYKMYNTAAEQDPEAHQQDFVIRKLKQNADSRTKLRLGDQEREEQDGQSNRSQLKRKRDSDMSSSHRMLRNNSQNSQQNYGGKNKRQKISNSKSKSRTKI